VDGVEIEPRKNGFLLKKIVEAQSDIFGENDARLWAQRLGKALSLVKNLSVEIAVFAIKRIPDSSADERYPYTLERASAKLPVAPLEIPLTEDILREAFSIVKQMEFPALDDHIDRAISWFARGLAVPDIVDKFIDHWIGLEALSKAYQGRVGPETCKCCGAVTNSRPNAAVLRGFLDSVGLKGYDKIASKLGRIRGSLFHSAKAMEEAQSMQPVLASLLKECLLRSLR